MQLHPGAQCAHNRGINTHGRNHASYSFTPAVTGGAVAVTGNSESEIKAAVKAVLTTRTATTQAQLDALSAASTEMDS